MKALQDCHAPRRRTTAFAVLGVALGLTIGTIGLSSAYADDVSGPIGITPATAIQGKGVYITNYLNGMDLWLGLTGAMSGAEDPEGFCDDISAASPTGLALTSTEILNDPIAANIIEQAFALDTKESYAAASYFIHLKYDRTGPNSKYIVAMKSATQAQRPDIVALADQMLQNAQAQAGPFTSSPTVSVDGNKQHGYVNIDCLRTIGNECRPNSPLVATLDDNATFDASGASTWSGVVSEPIKLWWSSTKTGIVTGSLDWGNLGRVTIKQLSASGNVQGIIQLGSRDAMDPGTLTVPIPPFAVVKDFQPTFTSSVSKAILSQGEELVDTFYPAAAPGDEWVSIDGSPVPVTATYEVRSTGSAPAAESAVYGAGAVLASGTFVTDGTAPVPVTVLPKGNSIDPQSVTVTVNVTKDAQPAQWQDYIRPWSSTFGIESETAIIRSKIKHQSQTRDYLGAPGSKAYDTITIDGFPADHGTFDGLGKFKADVATQSVVLAGPFTKAELDALGQLFVDNKLTPEVALALPNVSRKDYPAVNGVIQAGSNSNGSIYFPQVKNAEGDTYVFLDVFSGDDRVEPFVSDPRDELEQMFVPPAGVVVTKPVVRTQAVQTKVGEPYKDLVIAEGDEGYPITVELTPHLVGSGDVTSDSKACTESTVVTINGPGVYGPYESTCVAKDATPAYWTEDTTYPDLSKKEGLHRLPNESVTPTDVPTPEPSASATGDGSASTGEALASTGSPVAALLTLAVALLGVGGVVMFARRRGASQR